MSKLVKINFHGDELEAVQEDGKIWVSVKRMCEALEISSNTQIEKLKGVPWSVNRMMLSTGKDGKTYEHFMADVDTVPMWLATINIEKIKEEAKPKLAIYQKEAARVLKEHFLGTQTSDDLLLQSIDILRQMRQKQLALESRVDAIEQFRDESYQALNALPPATVPAPEISLRSSLNELVRTYCYYTKLPWQDAWSTLYRKVRYALHVNVYRQNDKPLDILEREGLLPQVYALAQQLFTPTKREED